MALNSISGNIYEAFDTPLPHVIVIAFDKDLRTEQLIGNAITDTNGFKKITYDPATFPLADSKPPSPDVFIRVTDQTSKPFGQSSVHLTVLPQFVLDFNINKYIFKSPWACLIGQWYHNTV